MEGPHLPVTLAPTLPLQQPDWRSAIRQCLGHEAGTDWFMEMDGEALEVYLTEDKALVVLDRQPMHHRHGEYRLRPCILGTSGTKMKRTAGPMALHRGGRHGHPKVLVGSYHGQLGGLNVLLEQYQRLFNGVLLAKVLVVRHINPHAAPVPRLHDAIANQLLAIGKPMPPALAASPFLRD